MATTGPFQVEVSQLNSTVNNTAGCLGELDNHLKALAWVQDELHAAVVSQHTGQAIYQTLGDAHQKGKSLGGALQQLIDTLKLAGASMDASDLDSAGKVLAGQVADGGADSSQWVNTSW
ncbi:hypothetical protein ACFROC_19450 [Nocardia tengchongensis]|uniref:hypothetical protein n=1 Tax=Nocardia tengchongensis TaxID=2055889 RepID=UPI003686E9E6